jgi:multidrug efflux system outer membrane protein
MPVDQGIGTRGRRILVALAAVVLTATAGCTLGPNYKRPSVTAPTAYRGLSPEAAGTTSTASLADQKWWEVFQDNQLQDLIRTALSNNYDVRIAASRVLQAQGQLGITRADQYPTLNVGGTGLNQRSPAIGPIPTYTTTYGQVTASSAWNLDFWGKYRRATE